eukprot:TRINITY_DN20778_c0_g1_i1.p1 TRINITY_DN20778_c0_g1~~TRINITY_DN20778_c0_g1_i1.p1  ORF type:complete len:538 (+),score=129.68 TRINITY_DN20778_c0_g1_i1:145-1758(+)
MAAEGDEQPLARQHAFATCADPWELYRLVRGGAQRVELRGSWRSFKSCTRNESWVGLRGLSLNGCRLTADNLQSLARSLPPQLSAFGVSNNPGIAMDAWIPLWGVLPDSIEDLDFGKNALEDEALPAICENFIVPRGAALSELRLDCNEFQSLTDVALALSYLPRLGLLDLSNNAIDEDGLEPLLETLAGSSLRVLKLGGNPLGNDAASALLTAARGESASCLQTLHLDNTGVDDAGLPLIHVQLAQGCPTLRELHLEETSVTDEGLHALMTSAAGRSGLRKLHFGGGALSEEALAAFADVSAKAVQSHSASRPGTAAGRPGTSSGRPGTSSGGRPGTASGRPGTSSGRPGTSSGRPSTSGGYQPDAGKVSNGYTASDGLRPRTPSAAAACGGEAAGDRSSGNSSTVLNVLSGPKLRMQVRKCVDGYVPEPLQDTGRRLEDEMGYIGSLATPSSSRQEEEEKKPVRLLTDEERALLMDGLEDRLHMEERNYERDAEMRNTRAWQDHVRGRYEPKLAQIRRDMDRMSSRYIFVEKERG